MTSKARTTVVVAIIAAGTGFATCYFIGKALQHDGDAEVAERDMKAFCRLTRNSVNADRSALRSDNPSLQQAATRRIINDTIYFGDSSARICLKDKMPDSSEWSTCLFHEDIPCVLARTERIYKLLDNGGS